MDKIDDLLLKLEQLPKGYISKKNIYGKEYFYLQYKDGNKLVSKYISSKDLDELKKQLEERNRIEQELKGLFAKEKNLNSLSPKTLSLSGYIMSGDKTVATFDKGNLVSIDEKLAPLIVKRTHDLVAFLSSRVLDTSRTNARILKRILNIHGEDDYLIALKNHATSVTDNYWFRSVNSRLKYKDVCLESDIYNEISLEGDISVYPKQPKLSPQFSLLGSFEKCWKIHNNQWWMYKKGSKEELLSEYISANLSHALGIPTAEYELIDEYIRSKNFADKYNFEPVASLFGDNDSFEYVFDGLYKLDQKLAEQYLYIIWFDALTNNVDRHNENLGVLRDKQTGEIVSLSPNYDLNMTLFARNKTLNKERDGFINLFLKFVNNNETVKNIYKSLKCPCLDDKIINELLSKIDLSDYSFDLSGYLLYRYEMLKTVFNL